MVGSRAYLPPGGSPGGSRRSDSRLIVLRTTPRVAPGLLSLPAWQVLRAAGQVLAGSPGHPQLAALEQAGIGWELAPEEAAAARATRLIALASTCDAPVVWLAAPTGEDDLLTALAEAAFDTEVLSGSHDLPGGRLLDLVAAMDTLRTDCPWDAEQTHRSLAPHLIEESYEALEALESGDARDLRDELGDVLLQVVFHARIAAERNDGTGFTIDDVADAIVGKLVRRHPHVFGDVRVSGADEVKANWAAIKAAERAESRGRPGSALDGIPFGQPALSLAAQLHARAAAAGAHPDLAAPNQAGQGNEIGARLLALVAEAGGAGLNPELELRAAARRFADGVRAWERENAPGVD
ncbi:MAG TPA: MazG family protein [Streptosporangiaceae bacterium]|nr:MazG family protein [Streptosporangiaceae bacterium]